MTVFAVIAGGLGLAVLCCCLVLLWQQRGRLARIETRLAEQPAGLSEADAMLVAEMAAELAATRATGPSLPPALNERGAGEVESRRRSETRIKASGWAAGASETMRRLRQGA